MNCDQLRNLFELYSLGLLDATEKQEIDAHLNRGCEICQGSLRNALGIHALFLSATPDVVPPSRLRRRVLASIGLERSSWTWLAALAAAAMLLIMLWMSVQERDRTAQLAEARRTIIQMDTDHDHLMKALSFLNQPETKEIRFGLGDLVHPRGNILINPKLGVLFSASNLPTLPSGKTYEMWVIPKSAAPRPAGLFQPDASHTALHLLTGPLDLSNIEAIAISVEPSSGSSAPSTTPLLTAAFTGA